MAGRFELMILITGLMTLAFMLACVSTGTDNWITVGQTGKDADVISLNIEQGLFEKCVSKKMRSRTRSNNCYSLYQGYGGYTMKSWEKAVAGLMVTSALLMGLVVIFSGYLMLRTNGKSGILSDVSPVIIGNIAAILQVVALAVYNSKYEVLRKSLVHESKQEDFADTDVDFGYSFYVGWMAVLVQFFSIFFFFIFKAWLKQKEENRQRKNLQYKMPEFST